MKKVKTNDPIVKVNQVVKPVDKTLDVLQEMERTLTRLKLAFKAGLDEMGEITKQDIDYNIDLVSRLMHKKFGK